MASLSDLRAAVREVESWLAAASLLLLLVLSLAQIVARNLFDSGLAEVDTLSRYLVLYVTFFGAVLAVERNRHIKIDVVSALLPPRAIALLYRPLQALAALVCALLTRAALRLWLDEWSWAADGERWQVYVGAIVPLGFLLLTLHLALAAMLGPDDDA